MKAIDFCYWLHGFDEISGGKIPDATQWQIIRDHLMLVMYPNLSFAQPDMKLHVC
jgi:hypothetical protein